MRSKNVAIVSLVVAVLAVAILGTVAFGVYNGLHAGQKKSLQPDAVITGHAPGALPLESRGAAPFSATDANVAIAERAPGSFSPGAPPFGGSGGVAADGISAWGVASKEVSDANAQADSAMVKAAYQDAEKQAADLASATGNRVGKLVALTDYTTNQPYYKPCIQNFGPPKGIPVPQGKPEANGSSPGAAGSSSTGSGSASPANGVAVGALPPVPGPCQANNNHYLVVWVYVRHAL